MTTAAAPAAPAKTVVSMTQDPFTKEVVPTFIGGDPDGVTLDIDTTPEARGDVFEIDPDEPFQAITRARGPDGKFLPKADAAAPPAETPAPDETPVVEDPPAADPPVVEDPPAPPAAAKTDDNPTIPRSRLNQEIEKRKALEARNKALEEQLAAAAKPAEKPADAPPAPPAYDFDAKEQEYIQLMMDGSIKEAAKLRTEINTRMYQQIRTDVTQEVTQTTTAAITQKQTGDALNALADQYALAYPQLDINNEEMFDQTLVDEVKGLYAGYSQQHSQIPAFKKAVEAALKLRDIPLAGTTPKADPPAPPPAAGGKAADVRAKAAAAKAQPPALAKNGVGDANAAAGYANIDMENLTAAEMDALPPEVLGRLRGDFL
jgi:hypothetical protein